MTDIITVALISALVQVAGLFANNQMTSFRLKKLEEKVDKHNNVIERLYKVEERAKSNTHRLNKLEQRSEKIG